MTTLQEDIDKCKELEHNYDLVIEELEMQGPGMYGLVAEAKRKRSQITMKRLELESKGLV